jgi:hypothetical protein
MSNTKTAKKIFENVAKFVYFETTVTNKIAFTKKLKAGYVLEILSTDWERYFPQSFEATAGKVPFKIHDRPLPNDSGFNLTTCDAIYIHS